MIPYYFRRQGVERLRLPLIFVRIARIPWSNTESPCSLPEFLEPFVNGSVQLLSQLPDLAGLVSSQKSIDKGSDGIGHGGLGFVL